MRLTPGTAASSWTASTGLAQTIAWYLAHGAWVEQVKSGDYRRWIETNYAARGSEAQA